MDSLRRVHDFDHLKILSDSRRLEILRILMARPATLSQLGQMLNEQPSQIRYHLKLLEHAGLVEMVDSRIVRGFVEKYYRARARAFVFHELILPASDETETYVALGSHDLALELLAQHFREANTLHALGAGHFEILALPVGSLDGLIAMRQGLAQMAGCHLLDAESGEYNLPFVRHLFPDRAVTLFTLAHRQQGLMLAPGNPRQVRGLQDLARPDLTLINRIRGSGTRLWLDRQLHLLGIDAQSVHGYNREARTHTAAAESIRSGRADVGLGLQAAALQHDLDFIPLFQERFDLAIMEELLQNHRLAPFMDYLNSGEFRRSVAVLEGYDTAHTGDRLVAA
jgi:putative molybdopterin biosynthesis protein